MQVPGGEIPGREGLLTYRRYNRQDWQFENLTMVA